MSSDSLDVSLKSVSEAYNPFSLILMEEKSNLDPFMPCSVSETTVGATAFK